MEQIWNRLVGWGIDAPTTLERMCGDKVFYQECLVSFVHDENFALLQEAIDAENVCQAFDTAHTLKGVAANLGLRPFVTVIAPFVEELRHGAFGDTPKQHMMEIMACRADLCAMLCIVA